MVSLGVCAPAGDPLWDVTRLKGIHVEAWDEDAATAEFLEYKETFLDAVGLVAVRPSSLAQFSLATSAVNRCLHGRLTFAAVYGLPEDVLKSVSFESESEAIDMAARAEFLMFDPDPDKLRLRLLELADGT